ncbi:hypothetical protein SAMN05421858_3522 [Haladaptatus litoreus]|uniref:Halobacterial output domain-containing protein n=1 Tax=Haladaptatus litoreus TaxID=553468 RepID=A0A1N7DD73_9EURY|nr:HalOD1 output domain-containing protein [Haladaptatus litoreus]SIR73695.1 hypothetical protein SAMN05421858_3522 [Haladaptatus litoreus]
MRTTVDSPPEPSLRTAPVGSDVIVSTIIRAITEVHGSAPATPLYEAIDPDALESLYQHGSPTVRFEYIGYHITIHPDQTITVSDMNS